MQWDFRLPQKARPQFVPTRVPGNVRVFSVGKGIWRHTEKSRSAESGSKHPKIRFSNPVAKDRLARDDSFHFERFSRPQIFLIHDSRLKAVTATGFELPGGQYQRIFHALTRIH
jgi:hypothetical protein